MFLPTTSRLSIASPLTNALSSPVNTPAGAEQSRAAREKVGMALIAPWSLLHVQGSGAEAIWADSFSAGSIAIGSVLESSGNILLRLRRDEFLLLIPDLQGARERYVSKPAETLVTWADITHGRGVICLCGPHARDVLPKICGLDFSNVQFPDCHAAQTSLAKVRALIVRIDAGQLPMYYMIVDRSLVDYVWEVVYSAAQEWEVVVLSQDSLDQLRK